MMAPSRPGDSVGGAVPPDATARANVDSASLPDADYSKAIRHGLWILGIGFGGFLAWAILAPLDEGVPAPGVVTVESKRKRMDHLTGGIIERIPVREGQQVREGDPLIVLNETQALAALNAIESQWRTAVATAARLQSERAGLKAIRFPGELTDAQSDPDIAAVMRGQEELFRSRRAALGGELAIVRESVLGLERQLLSLDALAAGREKQVRLFSEQFASFSKLHTEKFVSRNQLIEIERQLAEVLTKQSEDLANVAGVKARLAEFRMRGAQREIEYRREVETQLTEVQKDVANLGERLKAQRDTYARLVLRAPVAGTVVDLAFHTIGGIIKPGDRIMDIVPVDDNLIIEAQVAPQYIDRVHAGLQADVHFDSYQGHVALPVVTGKILVVSADALSDQRSGVQYYAIRVAVPGSELKKLGALRIQPGMQGTVVIKTGERTLLVYLLRPLYRRFPASMGEP